jgi:hypothetical protein
MSEMLRSSCGGVLVMIKWRSVGAGGGASSLKHAVAVLMDGAFRVVLELL